DVPARDELGGGPVHRGAITHVHRRELHRGSIAAPQVGSQSLEPVGAARPEHEVRTVGGEPARARLADTSARPGDQNHLPLDAIQTYLSNSSDWRCCVHPIACSTI